MDLRASSPVCAGGPWQFMPETAVRAGLRVEDCVLDGVSEPWTPTSASGVLADPPYRDREGNRCRIQSCRVDERMDLERSTTAALSQFEQAWNLDHLVSHPQRRALVALTHHIGLAEVLGRLSVTRGDVFLPTSNCDVEPCGLSESERRWLTSVVAFATAANCLAAPEDQRPKTLCTAVMAISGADSSD